MFSSDEWLRIHKETGRERHGKAFYTEALPSQKAIIETSIKFIVISINHGMSTYVAKMQRIQRQELMTSCFFLCQYA